MTVKGFNGTGLTTPGSFNWQIAAQNLVSDLHPDVVVIVMGANDGWDMKHDGATLDWATPAWQREYARRIAVVMQTFLHSGVDRVYYGGPPTSPSSNYQRIFASINAAGRAGGGRDPRRPLGRPVQRHVRPWATTRAARSTTASGSTPAKATVSTGPTTARSFPPRCSCTPWSASTDRWRSSRARVPRWSTSITPPPHRCCPRQSRRSRASSSRWATPRRCTRRDVAPAGWSRSRAKRSRSAFGARPSEVVFTASGTESDNLAREGAVLVAPGGRREMPAGDRQCHRAPCTARAGALVGRARRRRGRRAGGRRRRPGGPARAGVAARARRRVGGGRVGDDGQQRDRHRAAAAAAGRRR